MIRIQNQLKAFNGRVAFASLWASGALVLAMTIVVSAGVFWRYVLNDSLSWTEEVARYLMIWLAAIGAIVAMHRKDLVAINILPDALSGLAERALRIFISCIALVTSAFLVYYGYFLADNAWGQSAASFKMPMFFVTIAIPIAASAFCLIAIENIMSQILNEDDGLNASSGEQK